MFFSSSDFSTLCGSSEYLICIIFLCFTHMKLVPRYGEVLIVQMFNVEFKKTTNLKNVFHFASVSLCLDESIV
jgi:hypothetical protein